MLEKLTALEYKSLDQESSNPVSCNFLVQHTWIKWLNYLHRKQSSSSASF